jgi:hypothetical protein
MCRLEPRASLSTTSPVRRTDLIWLPFWLASTKPAASRRRLISRRGWGLSRPNLDLDQADLRRPGCLRRFEVEFNRFLEIGKSLFLGLPLAGDIEFEALGDITRPLAPNANRKQSLHDLIFSQARVLRTAARVRWGRTKFPHYNGSSAGVQHASRRDPTGILDGRSVPEGNFGTPGPKSKFSMWAVNRSQSPERAPVLSSGGKLRNDLRSVAPRHWAYLIIPKRIDHVARNRLLNVVQHSVSLRLGRPCLAGVRPCINE